jgi:hypothetical protein
MAKLTFTIETDDTNEMTGFMQKLFNGTAHVAAPAAEVEDTDTGEAPKRTRRTKAEMAAVAEDTSVAGATSGGAPTQDLSSAGSGSTATSAASPSEAVTLEMVKAAGTVLLEKKDMAAVVGVLSPFGAKRFTDVKSEDLAAVHAKLLEAAK